MLDKVGGKDLPVAEDDKATEKDDAVTVLAANTVVTPVKKRSIFVSMFMGLLQIILMIAVLFGRRLEHKLLWCVQSETPMSHSVRRVS